MSSVSYISQDKSNGAAESQSAGNKTEREVVDEGDDNPTVDHQIKSSTNSSDSVNVNYPPMPVTAQHVSEVQERILRGSSVNEDLCSPISADTVDVGHAGETAVDPGMIGTRLVEATPDVFPDVNDLQECHYQTERVTVTPRSVTNRRSRIVARFGLVQFSESTPDGS